MKLPELCYARLTPRGAWHIRDWRRALHFTLCKGECINSISQVSLTVETPPKICRLCERELEKIRAIRIITSTHSVNISGMTLAQAAEHIAGRGVPPEAELAVYDDYGDLNVVLEWHDYE